MPNERVRKIVVTGALSAIAVVLGLTRLGYIPWIGGASLTIMHIPVIIGAVLEGPIVGLAIGLIFGVTSLIQAAVNPGGAIDPMFLNPLISVLPRLAIGPVAWLVRRALEKHQVLSLITAGIAGSLTNTVLVLGMIGVLGYYPWAALGGVFVANGLPEVALSAILTLAVVAAWQQIEVGKRKGSRI